MRLLLPLLVVFAAAATPKRGDVVPGEYVVVFHKGIATESRKAHMDTHLKQENVVFEYNFVDFPSYAVKNVSPEQLAHLRSLDEVRWVEPNVVATIDQDQCNSVQTDSWGLQRTSLRGSVPTGRDIRDVPYQWNSLSCGQDVEIHVQDTGILTTHEDFGGRAVWGGDWTLEGEYDGHGHGTHVASTAAGSRYGLARCARIVACKVMTAGGFGTLFSILGGLDYSATTAERGRKVVINMSLGALANPLLDAIANSVVERGAFLVAAAGNSNDDACWTSPAAAARAWTIASSGPRDNSTLGADVRSDFSNWGRCVDAFAPGGFIKAAWIDTDPREPANRQYFIASGTSMACPHGAGVAAKYWSRFPRLNQYELRDHLDTLTQKGLLSGNIGTGSPNKLLFQDCAN